MARDMRVAPYEVWHAEGLPQFEAVGIQPELVPMPAFTGFAGESVIVCGGIIPLRAHVGEAWIILRQPVEHPLWIARHVREHVRILMDSYRFRRVQATIAADRLDWERWITFLGFEREGLLRAYGLDGGDCWMYARIRRE